MKVYFELLKHLEYRYINEAILLNICINLFFFFKLNVSFFVPYLNYMELIIKGNL